jgi:hypothetical protein
VARYAHRHCSDAALTCSGILVETAREVERKKKVLKSEVQILICDLQGPMELAGKSASPSHDPSSTSRAVSLQAERDVYASSMRQPNNFLSHVP